MMRTKRDAATLARCSPAQPMLAWCFELASLRLDFHGTLKAAPGTDPGRPRAVTAPLVVLVLLLASACTEQRLSSSPAPIAAWGSSGTQPGMLSQPTGIAVAADGTVLVADTGNDRVQAFAPTGELLWGFGRTGDGPGEFRRPMDLDLDPSGRIYVAELGGDRVQVFSARGELLRTIRGDGTPAGSFDGAAGVLASPAGDVYVADFYNDRVVRFAADGRFLGVLGRSGRLLPGRLNYPTDVAWLDGRVVVGDAYNHRVQLFTPDGAAVGRWGGPLGSGIPGARPGWFRVATGVATDHEGRVYVADFENHRIQVFTGDGALLTLFGSRGSGLGEFERPTDLDFGPDGRIYVVDFGNDRVQVFSALEAGR